jgi:hypothetical protein
MNQGEEKENKQINRVGWTAAMVPQEICLPSSDLNILPSSSPINDDTLGRGR